MKLYEADKHELLMLYWYLELRKDRTEFENLFAEPLRNLTSILSWAKNSVSIMFDNDDAGIRFAAWCAPYLSGAEFGAWSRHDVRGSKAHLRFMDQAYDKALSQYPTLIGLTKQPQLHNIHLKMGYEFKCEIPGLFDGAPALVYIMTAESRANRAEARRIINNGRRQQQQDKHGNGKQPIRTSHRKVREVVSPRGEGVRVSGNGSTQNGGSERADTDHQPRRGRKPRSRVHIESIDTGSPSEGGIS
jgi:hypothetical protein